MILPDSFEGLCRLADELGLQDVRIERLLVVDVEMRLRQLIFDELELRRWAQA